MAKENLIQYNSLTPDQARENGKRGGLASAASRRKRKFMQEILREVLTMDIADDQMRAELESFGLEPSNEAAIALSAVKRAIRGDIKAARFIRDTLGEKPASKSVVECTDIQLTHSPELSDLSDEELELIIAGNEEDRHPR